MSLSPTTPTEYDHQAGAKRRRTSEFTVSTSYSPDSHEMQQGSGSAAGGQGSPSQTVHIPKRGARACTACRKGKNRCEGEV